MRASMKGVNGEVYEHMQGNFKIIGLNVSFVLRQVGRLREGRFGDFEAVFKIRSSLQRKRWQLVFFFYIMRFLEKRIKKSITRLSGKSFVFW